MTKVIVSDTKLTNIANAIRSKNGETKSYSIDEMIEAIINLSIQADNNGGSVEIDFSDNTKWGLGQGLDAEDIIYSINYANGVWVAAAGWCGLYSSTDGRAWTKVNGIEGEFYTNSIHYENGIWVAAGAYSGIYYSIDGKNWTISNLTTYDGYASDLTYDNGMWIVYTYEDMGGGPSNPALYYSFDGITWAQANCSIDGYIKYLEYHNGSWVLLSDATGIFASSQGFSIYSSTDGINWSLVQSPDISSAWSNTPTICYGKDKWVLGYTEKPSSRYYTYFYYSTDGATWTLAKTISDTEGDNNINNLSYGNGKWIITSDILIWSSSDGINWSSTNAELYLSNIFYINEMEMWIGCGSPAYGDSDYKLHYSLDGIEWTSINTISVGYSLNYRYANGIFLLWELSKNTFCYSKDGKNWTNMIPPFDFNCNIWEVTCKNNIWMISISTSEDSSIIHYITP